MKQLRNRDPFALAVVAILIGAFVVRVAFVLMYRHIPLMNDPGDYNRLGILASHGHWFGRSKFAPGGGPTAVRTPVYPAFLALVYWIFGPHPLLPRLAQAGLGVVTVGLFGVVARQLFDRRASIAAMVIAAVDPALLMTGGTLLTESFFIPLELGTIACALAYRANNDRRFAYLAGALAGLATMTRPIGIILVPVTALLILRRPKEARSWFLPAAIVGIAAVVIAPWMVRNQLAFHKFVPLATIDGVNLAGTFNDTTRNDPRFPGAWRPVPDKPPYSAVIHDKSLDEAAYSDGLRRVAVQYARDHPSYVVAVFARNTLRLGDLGELKLSKIAARAIGYGGHAAEAARFAWYVIFALAIVGAFTASVRRAPLALWLAPLLFWATTIPFSADMRYRMPIEPFAILVAGAGAAAILVRLRPDGVRARGSADTD